MHIDAWQLTDPGSPMTRATRVAHPDALAHGQVIVEVAGCGVCHTDLGFVYSGVRTRHPLPLTLGHEIAGRVVAVGAGAGVQVGQAVVVPAVIPCGECPACQRGRGAICKQQFFPGNDDHGGFASHVVVPGRGLCVVDEAKLAASEIDLASLSVVADAVTTPYQAILNANLQSDDLAIFIGVGGVGGFGVQIARALGAHVVAIDVNPKRLSQATTADLRLQPSESPRDTLKAIRAHVKANGLPTTGWKIFETSGHHAGQSLAFALLGYDAHLAVVGYTRDKIQVRLSNLMAFDATMRGTWGCLPEHYPAVVEMVLDGRVAVPDAVRPYPMSEINDVFAALHQHKIQLRPVLIPDFG